MGIVSRTGLRQAGWILAALAALAFWHGEARAACDTEVLDPMFFMAPLPDPGHPAPCCAKLLVFPAGSAHKPAGGGDASPGTTGVRGVHPDKGRAAQAFEPALPDRPWRPYCERSSRLLR
jgi:hypothetical protein